MAFSPSDSQVTFDESFQFLHRRFGIGRMGIQFSQQGANPLGFDITNDRIRRTKTDTPQIHPVSTCVESDFCEKFLPCLVTYRFNNGRDATRSLSVHASRRSVLRMTPVLHHLPTPPIERTPLTENRHSLFGESQQSESVLMHSEESIQHRQLVLD